MTVWTEFRNLPVSQRFVDVNGVRTRLIEGGKPDGDLLVFLHGTGGHAEAFAKNFRAHGEHFRVVAMDMIGHGYTDAPLIEYGLPAFLRHLGETIDVLGADCVVISGESLGAMVGAHYAIQNPKRVKKLIMNTGMLISRTEEDLKGLRDMVSRTDRATGELTRDAIRNRLNWLMYQPEKSVTDELVEIRHAIYSQPGRSKVINEITKAVAMSIIDKDLALKYSNEQDLTRIECPTLIVWSDHNPGLSAANVRRALDYLKNGKLVVMKSSGHWPQWEESELYDQVALEFLL